MGASTMSGHYVCHIKKEGRWAARRVSCCRADDVQACHRNISDRSSRYINCVQIYYFSSTTVHQSGCVLLDHNWACFLFTLSRKRKMNPLNLFIQIWEKWHFKSICVNLMCTSPACRWVIYNDHKVCLSERPPKDLGYVYFYHRLSSS